MPVKPESRFYRRVNEGVTREIYRQKVGSLYTNGTPDFWYSGLKGDGWVEFKWLNKLSRNGIDPTKLLSPLQLLWINSRYCEGRCVMVIVGSPQGCAIIEDRAWNARVPALAFRYSISDVSAVLTRKFHDVSEVSRQSGTGNESDLSHPSNVVADRRSGV